MKKKPRLLIPITLQFGVRYLLRSGILDMLQDVACPFVLVGWRDDMLWDELRNAGSEIFYLPEAIYGAEYQKIRKSVDLWHKHNINSPTTEIDLRRQKLEWGLKKTIKEEAKRLLTLAQIHIPGFAGRLLAIEKQLVESDTNIAVFKQLVEDLRPDAVFSLTPFHKQEELLLRAAKQAGLPMATAIHSFDNLTTRGWIPVLFDAYFLWNQYNKAELLRSYPESGRVKIAITGTPQFDFYYNPKYFWSEEKWRRFHDIPEDRPVILFAGGPKIIAPHEPQFLREIDNAIENGEIVGRPVVLFRRHPVDTMERWEEVVKDTRNVIYDNAWDSSDPMYFTIRNEDLENLVSSLSFSFAHISTSSTMTVDGAIFDKPQISPAYDGSPGGKYNKACKDLYNREHYLPIATSGGVAIANSRSELIEFINEAFMFPEKEREGRKKIVREICTFNDGKSSRRIVDSLVDFLKTSAFQ